jgi:predicted flap endonuclease-1-like 5' DNA nuclease
MSAILIFIISFFCLFGLTIVVPTLPPAELVSVLLEIPEINSPISEVSGVIFVNAIINAIFWGIINLMIYGLYKRFSEKKTYLVSDSFSYPSLRKSTTEYIPPYIRPKTFVKNPPNKPRKRKTYSSLDKNIEEIEGIGPIYGDRLRDSGVRTIDDLLMQSATRNKRTYLAKKVSVSYSTILKWVRQADFFRITGVGKQYSSLLESAGVDSVTKLSGMKADKLYIMLIETNFEKNLVRRIPPYNKLDDWIERAKNLKELVTY